MKSFKVATFEFSAGDAKQEAADNTSKPHFWEDVLQSKRLQLEIAEQERLGKGKRLRKKVANLPFPKESLFYGSAPCLRFFYY